MAISYDDLHTVVTGRRVNVAEDSMVREEEEIGKTLGAGHVEEQVWCTRIIEAMTDIPRTTIHRLSALRR
jgi:hypothetical protein